MDALDSANRAARLIAGAAPDARAALKLPEALRGTAEPKPAFDLQAAHTGLAQGWKEVEAAKIVHREEITAFAAAG